MKTDEGFYDFHFLICTHSRDDGKDCATKGSQKLLEELKPWLQQEVKTLGLGISARLNKSGCLNRCKEGITCVAYPKGEWITDARPEDMEKMKEWIRERLNSLKTAQ